MTAIWIWLVDLVESERTPAGMVLAAWGVVAALFLAWLISGHTGYAALAVALAWVVGLSYAAEWMARDYEQSRSYETYLLCRECFDAIPEGRSYWRDDEPMCRACHHDTDRSAA